jgi:hypothetical protein
MQCNIVQCSAIILAARCEAQDESGEDDPPEQEKCSALVMYSIQHL